MLTLTILTGPLAGKILHHDGTDPVLIGRQSRSFRLDDSRVSRRHAELRVDDGQWVIDDLNSSNGTKVNRERITRPTPLKLGDRLSVGRIRLVVSHLDPDAHAVGSSPAASPSTPTTTPTASASAIASPAAPDADAATRKGSGREGRPNSPLDVIRLQPLPVGKPRSKPFRAPEDEEPQDLPSLLREAEDVARGRVPLPHELEDEGEDPRPAASPPPAASKGSTRARPPAEQPPELPPEPSLADDELGVGLGVDDAAETLAHVRPDLDADMDADLHPPGEAGERESGSDIEDPRSSAMVAEARPDEAVTDEDEDEDSKAGEPLAEVGSVDEAASEDEAAGQAGGADDITASDDEPLPLEAERSGQAIVWGDEEAVSLPAPASPSEPVSEAAVLAENEVEVEVEDEPFSPRDASAAVEDEEEGLDEDAALDAMLDDVLRAQAEERDESKGDAEMDVQATDIRERAELKDTEGADAEVAEVGEVGEMGGSGRQRLGGARVAGAGASGHPAEGDGAHRVAPGNAGGETRCQTRGGDR